jgi:hypothetical protein
MVSRATGLLLGAVAIAVATAGAEAREQTAARKAGEKYQVVKVCSLLSLAEVKKLAPWAPHLDSFAKAREEPLGTYGSSCNYPTADVQVMSFQRATIDTLKGSRKLEPVPGVGDEAYVSNNADMFAELYARVGPHLLTVQMGIAPGESFTTRRPALVQLGQAFAAKLR